MSLIIIIIGQKLFQMKLPNVIELFLCENLQNLAKTKIWLHTDISQLMYNDPVGIHFVRLTKQNLKELLPTKNQY